MFVKAKAWKSLASACNHFPMELQSTSVFFTKVFSPWYRRAGLVGACSCPRVLQSTSVSDSLSASCEQRDST